MSTSASDGISGSLLWLRQASGPFLERAHLAAIEPDLLVGCAESEIQAEFSTSGTTENPVRVRYTTRLFDSLAEILTRFYQRTGLGTDSRVALGYGVDGAAYQMHAAGLRRAGIRFYAIDPADPEATHHALATGGATALFARASLALQLAALADRRPANELAGLTLVLSSGMPLSDPGRDWIDRTLGVTTLRCAGATEVSLLALECQERSGMHLVSELLDAELLPFPLEPSPHAVVQTRVSELVVTTLRNAACPLRRYRLGDLVTVAGEPCPCGSTAPRLEIVGRVADAVALPGGQQLYAASIQTAVDRVSGLTGGFQCTVDPFKQPLAFRLEVEAWSTGEDVPRRVIDQVAPVLSRALGSRFASRKPRLTVVLCPPGYLGWGGVKYRRILVRRTPDPGA
ncbi:MAG: hypothetical protein AAGC55_17290 [Myxococcota bacterium]